MKAIPGGVKIASAMLCYLQKGTFQTFFFKRPNFALICHIPCICSLKAPPHLFFWALSLEILVSGVPGGTFSAGVAVKMLLEDKPAACCSLKGPFLQKATGKLIFSIVVVMALREMA